MTTLRVAAVVAGIAAAAASLSPALFKAKERFHRSMRTAAAAHAQLPPDLYYNQTLDHFEPLNIGWWPQRYWINDTFWAGASSGAPIMFYVEGEGAGSPLDVVQGQHVELAANYSALIVALEHRFFGASIPTADLSTPNLSYLSSPQAVGDVARFISEFLIPTYNLTAANRIITFGGSYPGALSSWLRLRLPHLVFGAFSTSSPVQAELDFTAYNDVVAAAIGNTAVGGSQACVTAMTSAFQVIDTALRGTPSQQAAMAAKLYSCAPPSSLDDIKLLASNLAGTVMGVVQYNDDMPGGMDVRSMCATMTAPGVAPIDAFATIMQESLTPGTNCTDNSYADFLVQIRNVTADKTVTGVGMRQWTWMTCIAFSYFQTCETGTQCVFSTLLDFASQVKICTDTFDARMNADYIGDRVNWTNDYFGAKADQGSRILYTNGLIDPWHALSVLPDENTNPANSAIVIPTGAHCRQMFPSSPSDPPDVVAARAQAAATLNQWLMADTA